MEFNQYAFERLIGELHSNLSKLEEYCNMELSSAIDNTLLRHGWLLVGIGNKITSSVLSRTTPKNNDSNKVDNVLKEVG